MAMTQEDNELMCRVEKDAVMGRLLKDHAWFPAGLSKSFLPGEAPQRVRLIGNNYVVWRAHNGQVAMFDEACPHRRVSLMLGRNEDNALRCIFHGWKFSVTGEVLEVPTEPNNEKEFCKGVPLKHYPVHEAAGIVWVWIGQGKPAALPDLEFLSMPEDRVYAIHQTVDYNWVQSVEGGMDAAHVTVLHQGWLKALSGGDNGVLAQSAGKLAPIYEFEDRPYGFRYAAVRTMSDGRKHIRVNEFVAPWYCLIAAETGAKGDRTVLINVPLDDYTTAYWRIRYNPFAAIGPSVFNPVDDRTSWPPNITGGPDERWGQDRAFMQQGSFSGYHFATTEDFAVSASQGRLADRSKEYLNSGDRAVLRVRRILLGGAQQFADGKSPSFAQGVSAAGARAVSDIIPEDSDWRKMVA
jgi:nitrite reductase/ring-hydroxylating ferredoxin subunit